MAIDSLSPLKFIQGGKLVPPLMFTLLILDGPCCWLSFELFYLLLFYCWTPGCEPLEELLSVASDMLGAVYLNLSCMGEQPPPLFFFKII